MSTRDFYLNQKVKRRFRDWTIEGLEFLLQRGKLQEDVERRVKKLWISW